MASQSWWQDIGSLDAAGTLYNTFTTAKSLLGSATTTEASNGIIALPPGFFRRGGRLKVEGILGLSNIVTTPGTFNLQVRIGGAIAFDTGSVILTTTAHTTLPLWFEIMLTCRAVGTGTLTTLMGQSRLNGQMIQQSGAAAADTVTGCSATWPATAPAVGTGFDNTVANAVDFFGGFSISNAGNGMQIQQYSVISCGNSAP